MINSLRKFFNKFRFLFFLLMLVSIILDIILKADSDIFILTILTCWYVVVTSWNLEANFSFFIGIIILLGGLVSSIFQNIPAGPSSPAENFSLLAYGYFIFGLVQKQLDLKKSRKTLKEFLSEFSDTEIRRSYYEIYYTKPLKELRIRAVKTTLLIIKFLVLIIEVIARWTITEIKTLFNKDNYKINILLEKIAKSEIIKFFLRYFINGLVLQTIIVIFILRNLYRQIVFYKWFYSENYLFFFTNKVGYAIIVVWTIVLIGSMFFYKIRPKILMKYFNYSGEKGNLWKLLKNLFLFFFGLGYSDKTNTDHKGRGNLLFLLLSLLMIFKIDEYLYKTARNKFEFYPYILGIFTDIASNWGDVYIRGHNFKDMPFIGKVTINDQEQKISKWGDSEIKIEIDPILSSTGKLEVINDYGFGKNIRSNTIDFTYFSSKNTTPETEKRFWDSLKEKARRSSFNESE